MNLKFEKIETKNDHDYIVYLDDIEVGKADSNWAGLGSEFFINFNERIFEIAEKYKIVELFRENLGFLQYP